MAARRKKPEPGQTYYLDRFGHRHEISDAAEAPEVGDGPALPALPPS